MLRGRFDEADARLTPICQVFDQFAISGSAAADHSAIQYLRQIELTPI